MNLLRPEGSNTNKNIGILPPDYLTSTIADITGTRGSGEFSIMLNALKDYQLEKRRDTEKVEETLKHISNNLHIISETETAALLNEAGFINVFYYYRNLLVTSWCAEKPF